MTCRRPRSTPGLLCLLVLVGCTGSIVGGGRPQDTGGGSPSPTGAGGGGDQTLTCEAPTAEVVSGNALYAQHCASCHGGITASTIASRTVAQIQTALGSIPQMNGLGAGLTSTDLQAIAATLGSAYTHPQCPVALATSNFTRSTSEVMKQRLAGLFPKADLSALLNPNTALGQALGMPDFVSAFAVTMPDSAAAQAAFQKSVVAPLCQQASTANTTLFATTDVLLAGEHLPADATRAQAFTAARNAWLVPVLADGPEVTVLTTLATKLKADGAPAAEVQQALCMAVLSAPQFWKGTGGKFEAFKRVAVDLGGRRPTFKELSDFNAGSLTLVDYLHTIQAEPGYLQTVKTWHRNWLGPLDYSKKTDRLRGYKYWWGWGGATYWGGQLLEPVEPSGTLDPTIPIVHQGLQNGSELSDSDACQPVEQAFDPTTQRIQWEQRVAGQWYVLGGWKLVAGAWQSFGGSVPVGGTPVATTLADISKTPATVNGTSFQYASGALTGLPVFAKTDRRVRRFTAPDDVRPNDPAPTTEQNGYSKVSLWWSGQPVYICNAFARFLHTCAYRPSAGTTTLDTSPSWTAAVGKLVMNMGGNAFIGVDSLAHPQVLKDVQCNVTVGPAGPSFSAAGTPNAVLINAELNTSIATPANWKTKFPAMVAELAALTSLREDMRDEPFNLVADIVGSNADYRTILTADWTSSRGPLELYYRAQGHYLPGYPPGATRLPGASDYLTVKRFTPMTFNRLPRPFFTNALGGQVAGNSDGFRAQNGGAATSAIDDPSLADLAPRPISGLLTQAAFLGPATPKMRTVSARILRTFTCAEVNAFVPDQAQAAVHHPFVPTGEKGGAQHVDPASACYACHINMDPLASALSAGFMLKTNPFTKQPILSGSEYISALGELAPYETDDVLEGFRYGVRGNLDLPGSGALFGQPVTGVRQVGQVLSRSDQFARCAVTQAFTSVFGRPPALPEDQPLLDDAKRGWAKAGYSYNTLVELLVTSPQFQLRN